MLAEFLGRCGSPGVSLSPISLSSAMSADGASAASVADSAMSSADTCVSSDDIFCMSSRVGGVAVLAGFLVLLFLFAFVVLFLGFAGAVFAHFERLEQIVDDVAELALVLDEVFEAVEIVAGAFLDQRTPQIDQLARGRRRRQAGEALAHHQGERFLDRRIGAVG